MTHHVAAFDEGFVKRFWDKVQAGSDGDCWPWTAALAGKGYGHIKNKGKFVYAHRASFELKHGPIPDGLLVCHKCDNMRCVNPSHLYAGTYEQNAADTKARGRRNDTPTTKLSPDDVRQIRRDPAGPVELARRYGVDRSTIRLIRNRKQRADVL